MTLKKYHYIIIITVVLILCVFLVFITLGKSKMYKDKISLDGEITIIEEIDDMTDEERLELEQNMAGDEAVLTEEIPVLICNITDVNTSIIGNTFLPFIAMTSYHDKVTEYLKSNDYTGVVNLYVIDEYVYKSNNYYHFAFFIEETQETIYCSFDEISLSFNIRCS